VEEVVVDTTMVGMADVVEDLVMLAVLQGLPMVKVGVLIQAHHNQSGILTQIILQVRLKVIPVEIILVM
jgi:hypothetical protein